MAAALSKSRDPGMVKTAFSETQTLSEYPLNRVRAKTDLPTIEESTPSPTV